MTTFKLTRKASTREWVIVVYVDGKRDEARCYYTNDKADAISTMTHMQAEDLRLSPNELYYASLALQAASGERYAMRIMQADRELIPPEVVEWYSLISNLDIRVGSPEHNRLVELSSKYDNDTVATYQTC